jgi:undecaprenyl diphosphate synthase
MQSSLQSNDGLHVAIIMDGNGRWAARQGLPRPAGHRAGVESIRRVCETAPSLRITTLTLFAFSADNWQRPQTEVRALMGLLRRYLRTETTRLRDNGVRLTVFGRRDRLPDGIADEIATAEAETAAGRQLHLRIAFDYSARDAILRAAAALDRNIEPTREALARLISGESAPHHRDVDLLIRTSGEKRLSDFLLWECAYAELYFTDRMWPDFSTDDLAIAINEFHRRERRFGALPNTPEPARQVPSAA